MVGPPERYGQRRRPEVHEDRRDQTQPIPRVADNRETATFMRPGSTEIMPPLTLATPDVPPNEYDFRKQWRQPEKVTVKTYRPGIVMRIFGYVLAALFAMFCLGIIAITLGYILWKYYHLLD